MEERNKYHAQVVQMREPPRRLTPNSFSRAQPLKTGFFQALEFLKLKKIKTEGVSNQSNALTAMAD